MPNNKIKLSFDSWQRYKMARLSMPDEASRAQEVRRFIKLRSTLKMAFNTYVEMKLTKKEINMNMDIILMKLYKGDALRRNALLWARGEFK